MSAGPGILSFATVVVLTMLATYAFDPKLIWDSPVTKAGASSTPGKAALAADMETVRAGRAV